MHSHLLRRAPALLASAIALLAAAPAAQAGTFDVLSCGASDTRRADAWKSFSAAAINRSDRCVSQAAGATGTFDRTAALAMSSAVPVEDPLQAVGRAGGLKFEAPRDATITKIDYIRRIAVAGTGWKVRLAGTQGDLETCAPPITGGLCADGTTSASGSFSTALPGGTTSIDVAGVCAAVDGPCKHEAGVDPTWGVAITAARVTIREETAPVVDRPTTSVGYGGPDQIFPDGTITIHGTDALGLRSLELLDGDTVIRRINGTCVDWSTRPCAEDSAGIGLSLTASATELGLEFGPHRLRARAVDGAGNVATSGETAVLIKDEEPAVVARILGGGVSNATFREVRWEQTVDSPRATRAMVELCPVGSVEECYAGESELMGGPLGYASARFPNVDVRIILQTASGTVSVSDPVPFVYDPRAPMAPKLTLNSAVGKVRTFTVARTAGETDVVEYLPRLCKLPGNTCVTLPRVKATSPSIDVTLPGDGQYRYEVAMLDAAGNTGVYGSILVEHGAIAKGARVGTTNLIAVAWPKKLGKSILVRGTLEPGTTTNVTVTVSGRLKSGKAFKVRKAVVPNAASKFAVRLALPTKIKRKGGVIVALATTSPEGAATTKTLRKRIKP